MRYTQSQVRDLIDLSVDTFRTWRDLIPALRRHKGHGPTFLPGDVIVLAIIAELVSDYGMRVGTLAGRLDQLFNDCRGQSWVSLEGCVVFLSRDAVRLVDATLPRFPVEGAASIIVPCGPIVAKLRAKLIASEAEQQQGYLQFPPTAVGAR